MRFQQVDPKNVFSKSSYKHTKLQEVIEEFVAKEIPVAKVSWDNGEYKSAASAQSSLAASAKRYSKGTVRVKTINRQVYLINTVLLDKEFSVG